MSTLISEEYREQQRQLHENPNYGTASLQYASLVAGLVRAVGARELLDYGAGKGRLGAALRQQYGLPLGIAHYDPAVPEWSQPPAPCAMVACIDVLEHIEPTLIDNVLDDLKRVVLRHGVFTVHTRPALKVLPDGRNAHLIQQPPQWWLPKIMDRFELLSYNEMPQGFWVFVERKEQDPANQGALVESSVEMLCNVIENLGPEDVLDYDSGRRGLAARLAERLRTPVEVLSRDGRAAAHASSLVAWIDALQDVEPERLDEELDALRQFTSKYAIVTVRDRSAGPAAPRVRQSAAWWMTRLMERFDVICYNRLPAGFGVVVERRAP